MLVVEKEEADYQVFNVGTGKATEVIELAHILAEKLGSNIKPKVENKFNSSGLAG